MLPLSGIRVLDLSRVVSGPFCSMQLGDLGADVIKIEEPEHGDDSRAFGPPFQGDQSAYFLSVNRNKRSCAINLKSPEGRALIDRLAAQSDVLIENFRPGTMKRLGLSHERLLQANPRLIYCAITGFGTDGPDAQRPGYDLIVQGESGLMDVTGQADGPPMKVGASVADLVSGLYATQAILASLSRREKTGSGNFVEVAMMDALASLLTFNAGIYFTTGRSPTRRGNTHPTIAPYETFEARDGWINLAVASDKFWSLFCTIKEFTHLGSDPRYAKAADRVTHHDALVTSIGQVIRERPRAHWLMVFNTAGVPCGEIKTIAEVCTAPQLTARHAIIEMPHDSVGTIRNIGSPIRFDGNVRDQNRPPPTLGQHTREVLSEVLSLAPGEIDALAAHRVIRIG